MRRISKAAVLTITASALTLGVAGGAVAADGASAKGKATNSPGVISGNQVQVPVHIPVNLCGNTVDVIALLDPAMGTTCTIK